MIHKLATEANERSTFVITASLRDEDGAPIVPQAADWTLAKLDGSIVNGRGRVPIPAPAHTMKITLNGDDTAILDGLPVEERAFILRGVYSGGRPFTAECRFNVKNITTVG